jgi:hypothetical protein
MVRALHLHDNAHQGLNYWGKLSFGLGNQVLIHHQKERHHLRIGLCIGRNVLQLLVKRDDGYSQQSVLIESLAEEVIFRLTEHWLLGVVAERRLLSYSSE